MVLVLRYSKRCGRRGSEGGVGTQRVNRDRIKDLMGTKNEAYVHRQEVGKDLDYVHMKIRSINSLLNNDYTTAEQRDALLEAKEVTNEKVRLLEKEYDKALVAEHAENVQRTIEM